MLVCAVYFPLYKYFRQLCSTSSSCIFCGLVHLAFTSESQGFIPPTCLPEKVRGGFAFIDHQHFPCQFIYTQYSVGTHSWVQVVVVPYKLLQLGCYGRDVLDVNQKNAPFGTAAASPDAELSLYHCACHVGRCVQNPCWILIYMLLTGNPQEMTEGSNTQAAFWTSTLYCRGMGKGAGGSMGGENEFGWAHTN